MEIAVSYFKLSLTVLLLSFQAQVPGAAASENVVNICMDATNHESQPEARDLHGLCKPWESNACCTNETAYHSQQSFSKLYNMNYNHCGNMSESCLKLFSMNNCFYECSPNVGPWIVDDEPEPSRNERFLGVPLCESQCKAWWDACQTDKTCVSDWVYGFHWTGTNQCPDDKPCKSFAEIFGNATNFCQSVYPGDYKVTRDSELCMTFDFTGPANPNAEVVKKWVASEAEGGNMTTQSPTTTSGSVMSQCHHFVLLLISTLLSFAMHV